MRLRQIYVSDDALSLCLAVAEGSSREDGTKTSADQVADEAIIAHIKSKYPNAQKFLDEIKKLRKNLARELKPKDELRNHTCGKN